jgi:hypothetical protein
MLPDILRRIVNAKYVLERAAGLQREGHEMSVAVSLLLMHDAVELLMHAVIDHLGLKKKFEFMSFWSVIKDAGHPEPPDHTPIESLNKLRVGLKHNAILPRAQTVQELLPRVRGFFENVLKAYCNLDYASVSLMDLISDEYVRAALHEAQSKFASGDKTGGLTSLRIALHKIQNPKGKYLQLLRAPEKPRMPPEMARAGWDQYFNQLHSFLDQAATQMNGALLDVDPVRYSALLRNTPVVQWSLSGKQTVIMMSTYSQVSNDDFVGFLDFLIEYALKAEAAYVAVPAIPPPDEQTS